MSSDDPKFLMWKHIGLHGHSVGTFAIDLSDQTDDDPQAGAVHWKSALVGRDQDEISASSSRMVPRAALKSAQWTVFGRSGHVRLQIDLSKLSGKAAKQNLSHELRFDGFSPGDFEKLRDAMKEHCKIDLNKYIMSAKGTQFGLSRMKDKKLTFRHCILEDADEEGEEFEPREGDEMLSFDLAEVSQCVLPGNNRHEIELQFPESDAVEANNDQLVSIRFYIPPDPEMDPSDKTSKTPAELLQQKIMSTANIRKTTGDVIVEFDHEKGSFLTPRGRYSIELYDRFFRMRGQKYDYKIKYDDISRLFLLPKPDEMHMAFVIALDRPIRQGQQRYQHLVLQTSKEPDEVTVNLDEETLKKEYGDDLQSVMRGSLSNLVAKTFKVIAKKKVFIPGKFSNAHQHSCVKCALRANEGLLYPLEKQFVFIHKPPILIRFNEIEFVEFQRYAGGQGSTRNFDLSVTLKASATIGTGQQEYVFSGIDRSDYAGLYSFLSGKNIRIQNLQEPVLEQAVAPVYNEDEIYGGPDPDGAEESEDEDYGEKEAEADAQGAVGSSGESEDDIDDDELGSEIDDELDSDLEDARQSKTGEKKSKKRPKEAVDDDGDGDGDDEPQAKKKKKKKDPNAPKNARSAWMLYSTSVRSKVAEENPDADFGEVTKLVSQQFKKLSDEDRAKWEERANADKKRYDKEMASYDGDDGGDAPKKANKKDPNAPKKPMSAYFIYATENRSRIKDENPDANFGDLARLISAEYKNLDADGKKKYADKAAADKKRYQAEMVNYEPPAEYAQAAATAAKAKGKTKAKKDPNEPKRPTSSYLYFATAMRPKIKEENPGLSFGDLNKLIGSKFRELSSEDKLKYEEMAKKDKKRHQKQMADYEAKKQKDTAANDGGGDDSDSDDSGDDSD